MKKLRILLADDHKMLREGLRVLLDSQPGMHVVGEAASGKEVLDKAGDLKPDVVVMDLSMPGLNGLQATELLRTRQPAIKVVVLTAHEDESYMTQLCKAGAAGYVLKRSAGEQLVQAIRMAARARCFSNPALAGKALARLATGPSASPRDRQCPAQRAGEGGLEPDRLGLQQQGSRRQAQRQRQNRRDLQSSNRGKARPAEPHRTCQIRFAAGVAQGRGSPRPAGAAARNGRLTGRRARPADPGTPLSGNSPTQRFCFLRLFDTRFVRLDFTATRGFADASPQGRIATAWSQLNRTERDYALSASSVSSDSGAGTKSSWRGV